MEVFLAVLIVLLVYWTVTDAFSHPSDGIVTLKDEIRRVEKLEAELKKRRLDRELHESQLQYWDERFENTTGRKVEHVLRDREIISNRKDHLRAVLEDLHKTWC